MSGSTSFSSHATPEFHRFLQDIYRLTGRLGLELPAQYSEGFRDQDHLLTTWSDAWTYADGGIPSFENYAGYREGDSAFSENIYHSNFDTSDLFQAEVFEFNAAFYGLLAVVLDRPGTPPLDFTAQADRQDSAADYDVIEKTGGPEAAKNLEDAIAVFRRAAETLNKAYPRLIEEQKEYREGFALTRKILDVFRTFQNTLVRLDWEDCQVFLFEQTQRNITALKKAVAALDSGNGKSAAEALGGVDNNRYALYFSRPVVGHEYEQVFGEANRDKLY